MAAMIVLLMAENENMRTWAGLHWQDVLVFTTGQGMHE
jgi:hypothetical protein